MQSDLCIAEVAGWRALLTTAQHSVGSYLPAIVDDYVIRLLYQAVGQPAESLDAGAAAYVQRTLIKCQQVPNLATVGDQSLLFAGLFPEHAIREGIPLAYFVQLGINAYGEYAATAQDQTSRTIYSAMADCFITVLDALHTVRALAQKEPVIDPLNAYQLWQQTGSAHAWQVLRRLTRSLPGAYANRLRH